MSYWCNLYNILKDLSSVSPTSICSRFCRTDFPVLENLSKIRTDFPVLENLSKISLLDSGNIFLQLFFRRCWDTATVVQMSHSATSSKLIFLFCCQQKRFRDAGVPIQENAGAPIQEKPSYLLPISSFNALFACSCSPHWS